MERAGEVAAVVGEAAAAACLEAATAAAAKRGEADCSAAESAAAARAAKIASCQHKQPKGAKKQGTGW